MQPTAAHSFGYRLVSDGVVERELASSPRTRDLICFDVEPVSRPGAATMHRAEERAQLERQRDAEARLERQNLRLSKRRLALVAAWFETPQLVQPRLDPRHPIGHSSSFVLT